MLTGNRRLAHLLVRKYRRRDSNPHALNGHRILNPTRLPIPPLRPGSTKSSHSACAASILRGRLDMPTRGHHGHPLGPAVAFSVGRRGVHRSIRRRMLDKFRRCATIRGAVHTEIAKRSTTHRDVPISIHTAQRSPAVEFASPAMCAHTTRMADNVRPPGRRFGFKCTRRAWLPAWCLSLNSRTWCGSKVLSPAGEVPLTVLGYVTCNRSVAQNP
jgi:hypothetical protein